MMSAWPRGSGGERLNRAIEAVKFVVPIAAEFPLAQAAQAKARVEAGDPVV
ncbi:MAG TPA: hypothetical protein VFB49_12495 [Patescibacteria group bacterium]|nr:hypothetical protein [Patescibacteria group bacterium]